jgi:putative nucleotidyltransferase with HDIG domain
VDGLADAVTQNRNALVALTAMRNYDNYTFTHMVNVCILTMGQAQALGIEGRLLREFGLSALMHDIGKVRTPQEILNKPDRLTDEEFVIMRRHPLEGAEILRRTPEMPILAPVVAFAHHLRLDGSGYPFGAKRTSTTRCVRSVRISRLLRPSASWRFCVRATARISRSTSCGASCSFLACILRVRW